MYFLKNSNFKINPLAQFYDKLSVFCCILLWYCSFPHILKKFVFTLMKLLRAIYFSSGTFISSSSDWLICRKWGIWTWIWFAFNCSITSSNWRALIESSLEKVEKNFVRSFWSPKLCSYGRSKEIVFTRPKNLKRW